MVAFSKTSLDLLRDRVDLVEVLSSHLQLKKQGATYKALCPFHQEKTPSFIIKPGDSHYHCFGCQAHGDAITFLMNHMNFSFAEAVENLADRFHISLEYSDGKEEKKFARASHLKRVLADAASFYHFYLLHTDEGHISLKYLYARGISLDFIKTFRIGFAPRNDKVFLAYMKQKEAKKEELIESALMKEVQGGKSRVFFYNRVMFPIEDISGSVIGFSGRKIDDETFGPKYINTSETPIFKKSKVLFGLSYARKEICKGNEAIIVEGQIDALRLIYEGFTHTVASQGTAFGKDHVNELIKLGVEKVYIAFDGDSAGIESALKVGQMFQVLAIEVMVVCLDEGVDPDTLVQKEGKDAFSVAMEKSIDFLTFLINYLSTNYDISTPVGKNTLSKKVVGYIDEWDHPLMIHEALKKMARVLNVPETVLASKKRHVGKKSMIKQKVSIHEVHVDPNKVLEMDLLRWMLLSNRKRKDFYQLICNNIIPDDIYTESLRTIYCEIKKQYEIDKTVNLLELFAKLENIDEQALLGEVLQKKIKVEKAQKGVEETVRKLLERNWLFQREEIKMKIHSGNYSEEEVMELAKEFDSLKRREIITINEENELC